MLAYVGISFPNFLFTFPAQFNYFPGVTLTSKLQLNNEFIKTVLFCDLRYL